MQNRACGDAREWGALSDANTPCAFIAAPTKLKTDADLGQCIKLQAFATHRYKRLKLSAKSV